MTDTIKVLFLAANPHADRPLDFGREVQRIVDRIRKSVGRDRLEFTSEFAVKPADLQDALLRHSPHVVHFSGHGYAGGGIWLEDEKGAEHAVEPESLVELFTILKRSIRVVVLNACDSQPAVEAINGVIDYAIGMSAPISDPGAIVFAEAFYGALASCAPVGDAFGLGVNRLRLEGSAEALIPRLFTRDGTSEAPLVAAAVRATAPTPPDPAGAGDSFVFNHSPVRNFNRGSANGPNTFINHGKR
jgi:hypothetical protein